MPQPAMASAKSTLPLADTPSQIYNHDPSNITALLQALPSSIQYSTSPATRLSTSSTAHSPAPSAAHAPAAVLYPSSTADVSAILAACHTRRVAVTSFSGGTSLGGALTATRAGGVCVSFRDMSSVLEVHEQDMDVRVQPGVGWVELNRELEQMGLVWPVDPALGARVGGMIAMSCSGTNASRYGSIRAWILSLTLVLADGTVVKTRNRPRKSSAGYDLTQLIIGSEGTLALVTEAVLRLTALPRNMYVGLASFGTMQDGVNSAVAVLRRGDLLEAIELADGQSMRAINQSGLAGQQFEECPTLFAKFAGSGGSVREQITFVKKMCEENGVKRFEVSKEKDRIEMIWGARKCLGNALVGMKKDPSDLFLHTDAAVPISKMATLVEESDRLVREEGADWFCASVGHVGDGNVHTAIVCPVSAQAAAESLLAKIQKLALELEGTITGEHGVGLKLRDLLGDEVGQSGVDTMRKIKMALDPRGILNPDKVVRLEEGV